jgi:hypothetical protein
MNFLIIYDDAETGGAKDLIVKKLNEYIPNFEAIDFTIDTDLGKISFENLIGFIFVLIPSADSSEKVVKLIDLGREKKILMFSLLYRDFVFENQIPNIRETKIFKPLFKDYKKYKNNSNLNEILPFETLYSDNDAIDSDISLYFDKFSGFIEPNKRNNLPINLSPPPRPKKGCAITVSISLLFVCAFGVYYFYSQPSYLAVNVPVALDTVAVTKIDVPAVSQKDSLKIEDATSNPNRLNKIEKKILFNKYINLRDDKTKIDSIFILELFTDSRYFLMAKNAKMDMLDKDIVAKLRFLESILPKYYEPYFEDIAKERYKDEIIEEWFDVILKVYGKNDNLERKLGSIGVLKHRYDTENNDTEFNISWDKFFFMYRRVKGEKNSYSKEDIVCIAVQLGRLESKKCKN